MSIYDWFRRYLGLDRMERQIVDLQEQILKLGQAVGYELVRGSIYDEVNFPAWEKYSSRIDRMDRSPFQIERTKKGKLRKKKEGAKR